MSTYMYDFWVYSSEAIHYFRYKVLILFCSFLFFLDDTSISFIMNQITIVHQNNLFDFENTNHLIDNLWLLIFSIILILGFFDVDSIWSKYWRYGLTIIMSILYFVLVNLNYGLTHSETLIKRSNLINNTDTGNNYIIFVNSSLCPQWIQKATLIQPVLWWTDHRGILWRSVSCPLLIFSIMIAARLVLLAHIFPVN